LDKLKSATRIYECKIEDIYEEYIYEEYIYMRNIYMRNIYINVKVYMGDI